MDLRKKYNYNFVKEYIESYNYTLLSNEYINNRQKLKVFCPNKHEYETTFTNFKCVKSRCKICTNEKQKHDFNYIKDFIESVDNYKLISEVYINASTKLKIKCNNNHEFEINFNHFKEGRRCSICFGRLKYNYENVKDFIESYNYTLLSNEYIDTKNKMLIKCPKNHEYEVTFNNFKSGSRCFQCYKNNKKIDFSEVKNYIESYNYKLISSEYIGCDDKLEIKCSKNHYFKMSYSSFKHKNQRCPICHYEKMNGSGNPNWNKNRNEVILTEKIRRRFSKNWIRKNMKDDKNYNNWLLEPKKYQIDHIIPISAFCKITIKNNLDKNKIKSIANNKRNLQIILKEENYKKFNKYDKNELKEYINNYYNWTNSKGIIKL